MFAEQRGEVIGDVLWMCALVLVLVVANGMVVDDVGQIEHRVLVVHWLWGRRYACPAQNCGQDCTRRSI